jgi:hypothetical protein
MSPVQIGKMRTDISPIALWRQNTPMARSRSSLPKACVTPLLCNGTGRDERVLARSRIPSEDEREELHEAEHHFQST